ncbi:hypothetical protein [Hyphomicrobium sp. 802]|uniref:hypothetical protein n=1 Tax=Hyphomicrobium sp. 802 TaxID=1112272 RepID=UPI00045E7152|nr:hypothetical protein [Hyphomicrobium sp. 802]
MSRPGALLLITAGIVLGSLYLFPFSDPSDDLAAVTRISVAPDRTDRERNIIPTFAPTSPSWQKPVAANANEVATVALPKPSTWTTVVAAGRSVVSPVRSSGSSDPATRTQLARDLQTELQRVGCYRGTINGSWTQSTRRAMAAFLDRANAVLPYNQPDYVLLALVQSHQDVMCSADCPSGQIMQGDGRCVPAAVIAQAERRQKRQDGRWLTITRLADGRAGERAVASKPTEREVLPWQRNQVVTDPLPQVAVAPRPDPLPGRMSIGGPLPPEVMAPPSTSVVTGALPAVTVTPNGSAKLAALQYEPDDDSVSDDADAADALPVTRDGDIAPAHKVKKSRRAESEKRRRYNSYAYSGKRRHGDPRPGTTRFNLMQSLGGVY